MDSWTKTQIATLSGAKTKTSLTDTLSRIVTELGFDYFSFYLQLPLPITRPAVILLENYPGGWVDRYRRSNYGTIDPTMIHGRQSIIPIVWQESFSHQSELFWRDASDHGLRSGLAQSCPGPGGAYGLLNLGSRDGQLSSEELLIRSFQLSWLTLATNQSITNILRNDMAADSSNTLTTREVEVLRWTAEGKTASEVGCIMDISERTVNFHIGNSLVKLDSNNKTSAVIKAAMLGLL